jgi:branched-chain amino acid transport system ATP-binding protein
VSATNPPAASPPTADALVVENLTVARGGRDVVRAVSLTVPRGEITALLGPNGAGKSSLVLAIAGILPARSGAVRVGGTGILGLSPDLVRAHGIAVVPEGHRVLAGLTVSDNLRVAAGRMTKGEEAAGRERVLALLPQLRDLLDRPAGKLSGGQQQMVALAQAVVDPPEFLVIDELSLGLAPVVVRRLVPTLSQIAAAGVGILLIEQFTTVALSLATTAGVLVRGRLRLVESAEVLRSRPELIHEAYLAAPAT